MAAVLLTALCFGLVYQESRRGTQRNGQERLADTVRQLRLVLGLNQIYAESFAAFMSAGPEPDGAGFVAFAESINWQHAGLHGIGWAPLVLADQRQSYLAKHPSIDNILALDDGGVLTRAPDAGFYLPLTHAARSNALPIAFGLDLLSEPARRDAVQTALDTRRGTVSRPIQPNGDPDEAYSLGFIFPVFDPVAPAEPARGVIMGLMDVQDTIEQHVVMALSDEHWYALVDTSQGETAGTVLAASGGDAPPAEQLITDRTWAADVEVGGRVWRLYAPPKVPLANSAAIKAGALSAAVALLCALIIWYGRVLRLSERRLERESSRRTRLISEIRKRARYEGLLRRMSQDHTESQLDQFDAVMNRTLASVGNFTRVAACYLYLADEQYTSVQCTHVWLSDDRLPSIGDLPDLPPERQSSVLRALDARQESVIESLDEASFEDEAFKARMQSWGVQSCVNIAIYRGETTYGLLSVADTKPRQPWDKLDLRALRESAAQISASVTRLRASVLEQSAKAQIRQLQHYNQTTGLPNRISLEESLKGDAGEKRGCLLLLDIRRFSAVVDSVGHEGADEVLRTLGDRLRQEIGTDDVLVHVRGDLFGVLLTDAHATNAYAQALTSRMFGSCLGPVQIGASTLVLQMTAAAAFYEPGESATVISDAETALASARLKGSNEDTVSFYDPSMQADNKRRLSLQAALRQAIADEAIDIYFQPQIATADQAMCGMEVLARWRHEGQPISPGEFIPLAEESNLIVALGEMVLKKSVGRTAQWRNAYADRMPRVSVNIDAEHFSQTDFVEKLDRLLREHNIPGSCLELEITERGLIADMQRTTVTLQQLRELGVLTSLDDFGTGYSSLAYLRDLPVDSIKIDRTFVAGIGQRKRDEAIVRAALAMTTAMDLRVIAEGVETQAQFDQLKAWGCAAVQGFLFGPAEPPDHITELLLANRPLSNTRRVATDPHLLASVLSDLKQ